MNYQAIVFVRRSGAYGAGHIGWAFANEDNTFSAGSVENHHGGLITPPAEMDFWMLNTTDPIQPMRARHYDEFKVIGVAHPNPAYAKHIVAWVHEQSYVAIGRNCMDDAYDVLRAYGVEQLPVPAHIWEPNHWFNHLPGQHYHIDRDGVDKETDKTPAVHGMIQSDLASLTATLAAELTPVLPAWRQPGTSEATDFQASIQATPAPPIVRQNFFASILRLLGIPVDKGFGRVNPR